MIIHFLKNWKYKHRISVVNFISYLQSTLGKHEYIFMFQFEHIFSFIFVLLSQKHVVINALFYKDSK